MVDPRSMFYGAPPSIFEKAKMLRKNMTKHENILWEKLRGNKLSGLKFRRQHPIHTFIADFYCHRLKLVIEVDGDNHLNRDQLEYDKGRDFQMKEFGIEVLRFTNKQIEEELELVLEMIKQNCDDINAQQNTSLPLP